MSVDTKARLLGKVEPEEILAIIKENYDKNARLDVKVHNYTGLNAEPKEWYDDSKVWKMTTASICFKDGEDDRILHYYYSNANFHENIQYYEKFGLTEMVKSETTSLSLGCWNNSVDIMKTILSYHSGWLDENDCDDEEYYPVQSQKDKKTVTPIIKITREELNKKLGGIVVIVD